MKEGKVYSFDPLNDLAALSRLFIKFGGQLSEIGERRSVWFSAKIGDTRTDVTGDRGDTIEVTEDYVRDLAALAAKVEKLLIEHAESHRPYPSPVIG
jgi:hypothetical protein